MTFRAEHPRRVLQVITPSHMSGAEMQLVRLTRRMEARGHALPIIIKNDSPALGELIHHGLTIDERSIGGKLNPWALASLARAVKEYRAEVVQSTLSSASWWCGWLERMGGPKSIGHVQGFTSATWHRHQSHLLAVSNAVKSDLVEQGIASDKITVLHNALAPEEFVPVRSPLAVRAEFGADAHTPVVGTFGHLSEKKGYRELFQAIPRVLRQFPAAQFWIIGRGPLRDELEQKARAEGFFDNLRFTGFRRDAADLMNAIDVFALPSHREPCALVFLEAAMLEKPIVACRSGGAPESIANGDTGILCPVGQIEALTAAISTLLDNREAARQMGRRGRERVLEIFSWQRFIATLEGVYDQVYGRTRSLAA